MDYIFSVTVPRVQKAKEVSFGLELFRKIRKLFDILCEKYILNCKLKIDEFKEKVSKENQKLTEEFYKE
ncbi:MAG: hypothetical protein U5K00_04595 [Melioribacteraceae bacterium]|nr:hypothetical protein [Melioribacteraceae bacterium]